MSVGHGKAYAVVAEIDENLLALGLDAVNGRREEDVFAVSQQSTHRLFPLVGDFIEKLEGGFRGFAGDLDFALVVGPNRNGRIVLVLINSDDLGEIDGEELMLV